MLTLAIGPCNSFYCLGHSKNVYDDDDELKVNFTCYSHDSPSKIHFPESFTQQTLICNVAERQNLHPQYLQHV